MTEEIAFIPLWMLLAAAFGFMIGWACGQLICQRDCAEEKVEDMRQKLRDAGLPDHTRQLKEMRSVLNDAHKHILAVSKGLAKPAR